MSDYYRGGVIRIPFPQEILDKCETKHPYDCEEYLEEKLGDLYNSGKVKCLSIECTDSAYYIDYLLFSSYGDESGDFGFVRYLLPEELEKARPIFDKLGVDYNDSDLRFVDYCYYNCSECTDYYDVEDYSIVELI